MYRLRYEFSSCVARLRHGCYNNTVDIKQEGFVRPTPFDSWSIVSVSFA